MYRFTPNGNDVDANTSLTYSITNKPSWATFDGVTGVLMGTPSNSDVGTTTGIVISISDSELTALLAPFTIKVLNVNDVPISTAQAVETGEDVVKNITLVGSDIDGDELTYSVVSQPAMGTVSIVGTVATYTPNANAHGSDSFTFKVNDGTVDSAASTVTIAVTAVNDIPVATAQSIATNEDTATAIVLVGSDIERSSLTYAVATQPAHGTLSGTSPNLTYTPAANYSGSDSFTFTVNDGTVDSVVSTVTITVTAVNDAPIISGTPATTAAEDALYSFTPTVTDVDAGDTKAFSVTGNPSWLTINPATGLLSGTPSNDNVGTSGNIVITVTDSAGATASLAAFTVTVTNTNDAPNITGTPNAMVNQNGAYSFIPTVTDVDTGTAFIYSITNKPTWASFNLSLIHI